ncbi:MAG: glycosyltransferase family 4 protein [Lacibacter sp.]
MLLLTAFGHTGGIEKFNRALLHAFSRPAISKKMQVTAAALYDVTADKRYTGTLAYNTGKGNRVAFVLLQLLRALRSSELVLTHLNLAPVALAYKWLQPRKRLTVVCHGLEVFAPVTGVKKMVLQKADRILAVSRYTRGQLVALQGIPEEKITVFPNTLDPFFKLPQQFEKPAYLLQRYGLAANQPLLFTLTRLNSAEGYKGYDVVLQALTLLRSEGRVITYLLAGKADETERGRMETMIEQLGLQQQVIMPGFIADEEVTDHYLLADAYVMPSKGEGFGIVYLEAMACGLPVIAGNKDGSTEALRFGELGTLVDPDYPVAVAAAIRNVLQQPRQPHTIQANMLRHFSFQRFEERVERVFTSGIAKQQNASFRN